LGLGYDLTLEIHNVPAEYAVSYKREKSTMDMSIPLEFNGVYKKRTTVIPLKKTVATQYGTLSVSGTLKINKSISNSNQE
jgi:hypothetical protein